MLFISKSLNKVSRASRQHESFEGPSAQGWDRKGRYFVPWISGEIMSPPQILYIFLVRTTGAHSCLCRSMRDQSGWAFNGVAVQMLLPLTVTLSLLMP